MLTPATQQEIPIAGRKKHQEGGGWAWAIFVTGLFNHLSGERGEEGKGVGWGGGGDDRRE